jgi:hypothetical protein
VTGEELHEEMGVRVDPGRVMDVGARQMAATFSAHKAHVFAVRLTEVELELLRQQETDGVTHGVAEDGERTGIRVRSVRQLLAGAEVDWSVLGMVLGAIADGAGQLG